MGWAGPGTRGGRALGLGPWARHGAWDLAWAWGPGGAWARPGARALGPRARLGGAGGARLGWARAGRAGSGPGLGRAGLGRGELAVEAGLNLQQSIFKDDLKTGQTACYTAALTNPI